MSTLLQINTSLFAGAGQSTRLAEQFAQRWLDARPSARRIVRDLATDPVPHLDAATVDAFATPAEQRSQQQHRQVALSDALLNELRAADAVVIGLPMYNFGVPSALKAYFDHIARAGVSFQYTANGPQGLLADKPVYVLAARGGRHAGQTSDLQTGFVRTFLNFIGLQSIEFIYAEGLNMGEATQQSALAAAHDAIARIAA